MFKKGASHMECRTKSNRSKRKDTNRSKRKDIIEIELRIEKDGTITAPWRTPKLKKILCAICGKKGSAECARCINSNPWCG